MSSIIQPDYGTRTYSVPTMACGTKQTGTRVGSFCDIITQASEGVTDTYEVTASAQQAGTSPADAYKKYLEKRFGPVTLQSIGKDQKSLEAAGKRMSGSDIIIAPNIFDEMVADPQKAAYYEQKISYFFTDVIPKGEAFAKSVGLTFEPCGVVVHEDGSVTYICGGGDPPERVAKVNRINRERDAERAAQRKEYQEQAAATAERMAMLESIAREKALGKAFANIGDLLKTQMVYAPTIAPEISLPAGTNMFFLNL